MKLVSEADQTHRPKLHPVTKECNTWITAVLSGDVSATGIQVHVNILSEWQTQMWDGEGGGGEERERKTEAYSTLLQH